MKGFLFLWFIIYILVPNSPADAQNTTGKKDAVLDNSRIVSYLNTIRESDIEKLKQFYEEHGSVNHSTEYEPGSEPRHPAIEAALADNIVIMRWLIDRDVDLNVSSHGIGSSVSTTPVTIALTKGNSEMLVLLLEAGADITRGQPLARAVGRGNHNQILVLLDHGADPNDEKALGIAAALDDTVSIGLLLDAGADPNIGAPLVTAVFWASRDAESMLRAAGADPEKPGVVSPRRLTTFMSEAETGLGPGGSVLPRDRMTAYQASWLQNFQREIGMRKPLDFSVRASSVLPDEPPYLYGPQMAFDENGRTAWNEGSDGSGVGEWIEITFDPSGIASGYAQITAVEILGGIFAEGWFEKNNRLKRARISLFSPSGSPEYELEFSDEMVPHRLTLSRPVWATGLRVEVLEVYLGSKWNDLPIAEIKLFTKHGNFNSASIFLAGYDPGPLR
ncbi:MAG: hypothetical protein HN368_09155 [Spirochaetales bacterium]|nr:hypothetical protein [Spirochaetales bacterium]